MIVVDASVLVPALAGDNDDGDQARERLRGEVLVAPELVDLEVVSALRAAQRSGALDDRRAQFALDDLAALPLRRVSHLPLVRRVWELRGNLTPYDASYVALAEILTAVLVTADGKLARAPGVQCRVELIVE